MLKHTPEGDFVLVPLAIASRWAEAMDKTVGALEPHIDSLSLVREQFAPDELGSAAFGQVDESFAVLQLGLLALARIRDELSLAVHPKDEWHTRHAMVPREGFAVECRRAVQEVR